MDAATERYLNAREFVSRGMYNGAVRVGTSHDLVGPVHAVLVEEPPATDDLRSICGVMVIVAVPAVWPSTDAGGRLCERCVEIIRRSAVPPGPRAPRRRRTS